MKFHFIKEQQSAHNIDLLCAVLEVSRSGYYSWISRSKSPRELGNEKLTEHIRESHENSRKTYGYRRIYRDLCAKQIQAGKNRIYRLMKANNIQVKTRKKFKVTTDSKHNHPLHMNALNREFTANEANMRWVSDITYIPTREGWLYLAVIMDLFSRKIIGWSMNSRMKEELTLDALKMALFRRKVKNGLLLHSDRGSQYAAISYQATLAKNDITCSMSRKGNCWDNAVMESFFHTLKIELVHHEKFQTREEAKIKLFEYIEVFYNRQRRHSAIDYKSPDEFELMQAC